MYLADAVDQLPAHRRVALSLGWANQVIGHDTRTAPTGANLSTTSWSRRRAWADTTAVLDDAHLYLRWQRRRDLPSNLGAAVAAGASDGAALWADVVRLAGCGPQHLDMVAGLAPSWRGTLAGLLEAASLLERTGGAHATPGADRRRCETGGLW